ncbi:MAG TPA: AbrB/MazE/SpoVT family DNA-binding domain-containing protein [Variovorax sp.]
MAVATLTSKGQITIPLAVRTALGLRPGAKVDFIAQGDGFKVVALKADPSTLKGRFAGRVAKPISIEAINEAIGAAAAARAVKRGRESS